MTSPLKPCPFCGWEPPWDDDDMMLDVLYPSGSWWFETDIGGKKVRAYRGRRDRQQGDQQCWSMNCTENMGGCGANIDADSREEVIAKWNRRI